MSSAFYKIVHDILQVLWTNILITNYFLRFCESVYEKLLMLVHFWRRVIFLWPRVCTCMKYGIVCRFFSDVTRRMRMSLIFNSTCISCFLCSISYKLSTWCALNSLNLCSLCNHSKIFKGVFTSMIFDLISSELGNSDEIRWNEMRYKNAVLTQYLRVIDSYLAWSLEISKSAADFE